MPNPHGCIASQFGFRKFAMLLCLMPTIARSGSHVQLLYYSKSVQETINMNAAMIRRKPGRPRAILADQVEQVISLYDSGLGYRAIARELAHQGVYVDWSTVRRVIKRWFSEKGRQNGSCSNCDTILTRGPSED